MRQEISGEMRLHGVSALAATALTLAVVFSATDAKKFTLVFLPALSGNKGQSRYFVGALVYALEHINSDKKVLAGHELDYVLIDNKADTLTSISGMTQRYFHNDTVAFVGPEDTCATEARVASAWNLPMLAYVSMIFECLYAVVVICNSLCLPIVGDDNHNCNDEFEDYNDDDEINVSMN